MATSARRGLLFIICGSAGGQILAFLAIPVLARVYRPSDYGVFAVVTAVSAIAGSIAAGRFDLAIPIPKCESEAQGLVALGLLSSLLTGTVTACAVGIYSLLGSPGVGISYAGWMWCIPPFSALYGIFLTLNQLAVRQRRFGAVGLRNVLQAVAMLGAQTSMGFGGIRPGGLVWGYGLGQGLGAIGLVRGSGLRSAWRMGAFNRDQLSRLVRRFRKFPLLLVPAGALNAAGLYLPVILMAHEFGPVSAGFYGLSQRVLAAPVTLVGTAVSQVFVSGFAEAVRTSREAAIDLFTTASRWLFLTAALLGVAALLLARPALPVVFGPGWNESARMAQAMALGVVAQMIAAPLSVALVILEKNAMQLAWDIVRVVAICGAIVVTAFLDFSAVQAVWALTLVSVIMYASQWTLSRHFISENGVRDRRVKLETQ